MGWCGYGGGDHGSGPGGGGSGSSHLGDEIARVKWMLLLGVRGEGESMGWGAGRWSCRINESKSRSKNANFIH